MCWRYTFESRWALTGSPHLLRREAGMLISLKYAPVDSGRSLIDGDATGTVHSRGRRFRPTHTQPPRWHFPVHLAAQSALAIMYSLLGNKLNLTNYTHNGRPCGSFFFVFLPALSWRPLQRTNVKTGWQVTWGGQCEYIITAREHLPFANCMKCIMANWATLAFVEFTGSSFMWQPLLLKW